MAQEIHTVNGDRITLRFDSPPSHNEYLAAVRPHGTAHRCLSISPDRLEFLIELVDVQAEIQAGVSDAFWICPTTLVCECCGMEYKGWKKLLKKDYNQGPYYHHIPHCPACPPVDTEAWLLTVARVFTTKPAYTAPTTRPYRPRPVRPQIEVPDFDLILDGDED